MTGSELTQRDRHYQALAAMFAQVYAECGDIAIALRALDDTRRLAVGEDLHGTAPRQVLTAVAEHFDTTVAKIQCGGRAAGLPQVRWVAMGVLRALGHSYPAVGRALGGMDHSTVIYGVQKLELRPDLQAAVRSVLERLRAKRNP